MCARHALMVFRLSRKHAVAIPARSQLSPSSLCSEPARAELLCERARASCRRRDQLGEQHTDRVAISNARLVIADDQAVVFRTRGADTATVSPSEFIGRFLLHILPSHFVKIRHFGLMASGNVSTKLECARGRCLPRPARRRRDLRGRSRRPNTAPAGTAARPDRHRCLALPSLPAPHLGA